MYCPNTLRENAAHCGPRQSFVFYAMLGSLMSIQTATGCANNTAKKNTDTESGDTGTDPDSTASFGSDSDTTRNSLSGIELTATLEGENPVIQEQDPVAKWRVVLTVSGK